MLALEAALTELESSVPDGPAGRSLLHDVVRGLPASTRTLRYANAGAPAALASVAGAGDAVDVTELPTTSRPVGMFEDTVFVARDYAVPPSCTILSTATAPAREPAHRRTAAVAGGVRERVCPGGRLESAGSWMRPSSRALRALTPTGSEDDCSVIRLEFRLIEARQGFQSSDSVHCPTLGVLSSALGNQVIYWAHLASPGSGRPRSGAVVCRRSSRCPL